MDDARLDRSLEICDLLVKLANANGDGRYRTILATAVLYDGTARTLVVGEVGDLAAIVTAFDLLQEDGTWRA